MVAHTIVFGAVALGAVQDTIVLRADNAPTMGAQLHLEEVLRVGSLDGPEESTFGNVTATTSLPDGGIAVADDMAAAIRIFDGTGQFVRSIGRRGEGPGEFQGVSGIALTPGLQLAVWDQHNYRITVFELDGTLLTTFPTTNRAIGLGPGPALVVTEDGSFHARTTVVDPSTPRNGPSEAVFVWLKYTSDGAFADTVRPPRRNLVAPLSGVRGPNGAVRRAFRTETFSALTRTGSVLSGRNSRYALAYNRADGPDVRIEREYTPVVANSEERRQWAAITDRFDEIWKTESPRIPRTKLPFDGLWIDDGERVWVARTAMAREIEPEQVPQAPPDWPMVTWHQPPTYDLIDLGGTFLGRVVAPMNVELVAARADRVLGIARGDFDEQYVVVYRLRPAG